MFLDLETSLRKSSQVPSGESQNSCPVWGCCHPTAGAPSPVQPTSPNIQLGGVPRGTALVHQPGSNKISQLLFPVFWNRIAGVSLQNRDLCSPPTKVPSLSLSFRVRLLSLWTQRRSYLFGIRGLKLPLYYLLNQTSTLPPRGTFLLCSGWSLYSLQDDWDLARPQVLYLRGFSL